MKVERYVDLHCHWVAAIDDGVKTVEGGIELLSGLRSLGFSHVVATPHMRPGMFDNAKATLVKAFAKMSDKLDHRSKEADLCLPERSLGSEPRNQGLGVAGESFEVFLVGCDEHHESIGAREWNEKSREAEEAGDAAGAALEGRALERREPGFPVQE